VVHHVSDDEHPHSAVVVGKAVGGSVIRHRRQRQIRHILAGMWDDLPAGSLVVRALPGDADFDAIAGDLRRAVGRL
jgi:ribonuclease P protein component